MTVASDDAVWPRDKLEQLNHCPVCGSTDRSILFEDLVDNSFRVAPGKWSLWKCTECSNAYLDPRPDRSAIGAAYARYYTHEEAPLAPLASRWAKFRQAIGNGYRNTRFGLYLKPALRAGSFITRLLPGARRKSTSSTGSSAARGAVVARFSTSAVAMAVGSSSPVKLDGSPRVWNLTPFRHSERSSAASTCAAVSMSF